MSDIEIIDTHCHLDISQFMQDLPSILERSRQNGVTDFILPGYVRSGWERILKISKQFSGLHPALGLHPMYLERHRAEYLLELKELSIKKNLIAIGEVGLDFYASTEHQQEQQDLFESQLVIAKTVELPLLLHVRKAHDQVLATLRRMKFGWGGIVHAFNGSRQQADQYTGMGFKLGYGGTLTYDRANRIRTLAAELPLDVIVLETDAPDIPLSHRRDKANSPEYLHEILDALVALRRESKEEIAKQTTANARSVLRL